MNKRYVSLFVWKSECKFEEEEKRNGDGDDDDEKRETNEANEMGKETKIMSKVMSMSVLAIQ